MSEQNSQKINYLLDYAEYVASFDAKISELELDTRVGIYIAGQMDSERRNKHNIAMNVIKELNDICEANKIDLLYNGSLEDRGAMAQAIFEWAKGI